MENIDKKKIKKNQNQRASRKKSVSKKQTTIGRAQYINPITGEEETFNVINEHDQDFNFEKIWLTHLLESLNILGNAKIKVLNWLLTNKNSENQIIATQREIAELVQVSLPIVNDTLKKLKEVNAIKAKSSGVYILNPEFMFKGKHNKRMNILLTYNKTKTKTKTIEQVDYDEVKKEELKNKLEDF